MKKIYTLTISLLLASSQNLLIANPNSQDNPNNQNKNNSQVNSNKSSDNTSATEQNIAQNENSSDKYDELVANAEQNGLEVQPMAKPSYLMSVVQRLGIIFFLNPYIFIVEKYRITRDFVIKYATISWEAIVGKKPDDVTKEPADQLTQKLQLACANSTDSMAAHT